MKGWETLSPCPWEAKYHLPFPKNTCLVEIWHWNHNPRRWHLCGAWGDGSGFDEMVAWMPWDGGPWMVKVGEMVEPIGL